MINNPSSSDIPSLKTMWKLCFPADSAQFIDFYFERIFKANQSLALWENGMLVAFLQILPYQIKIGDKIHNAGYISGAMTHPDRRKKGYMQQLLLAVFEEMKKGNYVFTFLIPQEKWLFDFYAKYGYKKAFPVTAETANLVNINVDSKTVEVYSNFENLPLDEIYHLYSNFLFQKENVVLKTKEQFCFILEDLFLSEGCVFYLKENGIAFVVKDESAILIKEIFYTTNNCKQFLLSAIGKKFHVNKMTIRNAQSDSHLYGMIKVLDKSYTEIPPKNIYMSMMLN
ncbi:MAG: GNAT family N-acetyltransferase [Dysgonamonadaceae bacterium]|jgi:predicted acetyltransferase|nr:GNAT family N-acetyltransferase [Dysgonamonadaceae bacterium]